MSGLAHEDIMVWPRSLETPQPEWSESLDYPTKGSVAQFAFWNPEYDFGGICRMKYLGDGVWASAQDSERP